MIAPLAPAAPDRSGAAPPRRPARWGWTPDRRVVTDVPPYRIHAVEFGHEGEPLVLLHGLSGSSRWWRRNVAALAEGRRVVVPDVIGFGRTRARGKLPPIAEISDLLAGWMDRLALAPVDLVGHSMGGQLAVHLAARHPEKVRRLVLVDAAGIPRPLTPRSLVRFAAEVAPPRRWGDPYFLPTIVGDAVLAGPRNILRAIGHILGDDVRPLLPTIEVPTLVVWGELDSIIPVEHAREFREGIPDARLAVLRGAAHNPMVDRPAEFNRLVADFLRGESAGE
ncbi:MAG TPA: alpha/beta fold hydrolase [Longimicrobiaceae bacterium]|nr:alpha/beta fold hydrolase [Longimicrobiaceae bacterium]